MLKVEVRKGNLTKAITILSKKIKEDGDLRRATERVEFQTARERLKIKQRRARKWKKVERENEEFVKNMS